MKELDWNKFTTGFGDELVATALVLVLGMGGSFYLLNKGVFGQEEQPAVIQIKTLGVSDQNGNPVVLPSPVPPSGTPLPLPTLAPDVVTVPFGQEGVYDYEQYHLEIGTPHFEFKTSINNRKFVASIKLTNYSVDAGLPNRLSATLIKDGKVIQQQVSLSLSESKALAPKETATYNASLSLIEGTDISEIIFSPGSGLPESIHVLNPQ
jgi:hypothetical protein